MEKQIKKAIMPDKLQETMNDDALCPIIFRYAEILLIYAEAHTHTAGFDSQTQAALNELRDRCGMPDVPTSLSKEEGLELIANERRIELAAEGFRSDDMYRYSDEYWNKHINNVEIAAPDGDNIITLNSATL